MGPYCRPSGRRILYTRRSTFLIFPFDWTLSTSSEYSRTAPLLPSCAGSGTFATACIHCGASPPRAAGSITRNKKTNPARPRSRHKRLVPTGASKRLQNDLLVIATPYGLIEITQCAVIFLFQKGKVVSEMPFHMERALVIFDLQAVGDNFCIVVLHLRHIAHLPAQGQLNAHIVGLLRRKMKVERVNARGMLIHVFFGAAEQTHGAQRTLTRSGNPSRHLQCEFGHQSRR